jgi:serine protease AprX
MVVVAAAGNGGVERIIPPASAPSAITAGGLDDQNSYERRLHRMYRSNYGKGFNAVVKPEVIAPAIWLAAPMLPGTRVYNEAQFLFALLNASDDGLRVMLQSDYAHWRISQRTLRRPLDEIRRAIRQRMVQQKFIHPYYQHVDGTSFAAPIVSSVVAQMLEANPSLSPPQIKEILVDTADPLDNVPAHQQGRGVVNAARAVAAALRVPGGVLNKFPSSPHIARNGVTFHFYAPEAHSVALVGRFNQWQPRGFDLQKGAPGIWQITIPLPPAGVYSYKFLIDGTRWSHDPENVERAQDGYGGFNSLLVISH